jgi:hypothetical protein
VGCGPIGGLGPRPWASWLVVEGGREQVQSGPSGFDHVVFVWDFTDKFGAPRALKVGTFGNSPRSCQVVQDPRWAKTLWWFGPRLILLGFKL